MSKNRVWQLRSLVFLLLAVPFIAAPIAQERAAVGGKFALELDGVMAGYLGSVEGGEVFADVVAEPVGSDNIQHKHIAGVKYEDITITCGPGMSQAFYEWIKATLERKSPRKNGAIVALDFNYKALYRLNFKNALISEVGFPALDAASKDPAKLTVKIAVESSTKTKTNEPIVGAAAVPQMQKKWLPANFRLKIDGLDDAMSRVNKVDAIVIKQKVFANAVGDARDSAKQASNIEIPNIGVTFPEANSESVEKWRDDFILRGNNAEKNGTLEFLTPDLKEVLFILNLNKLGIFRLAPEKAEAGGDQIRRLKAEMYCEEIKFSTGNAIGWK